MRRGFVLVLVILFIAGLACAAESAESGADHANVDLWKTVNFVFLTAGLGWLAKKYLAPYFRGRTEEIQQGIREARKLKEEAEARAVEMEERTSHLDAEIAELKESARKEIAAEESRLQAETERAVARMRSNAQQEISSVTKQARQQLRVYSTELALKLARQKVREQMTPNVAAGLMDALVRDLAAIPRKAD